MKLIQNRNIINFQPEYNGTEITTLTPGVYKFWIDESGAGLEFIKDSYTLGTIRGKRHDTLARMIGNDILDGTPVGALLTGLKGSGKTLTLQHVANKAIDVSKYVVFEIDRFYPETVFRQLIKLTNGKCVFLIDEFAKKYSSTSSEEDRSDSMEANSLLEILSDSSTGPVIWLLADNTKSNISPYLLNRPQRLKYHISYGTLDTDVISELMGDITDPDIIKYLQGYARVATRDLSYDVFSTVCKIAVEADSVDELVTTIGYLNVPLYRELFPRIVVSKQEIDITFHYCKEDNSVTVTDEDGDVTLVTQFAGCDEYSDAKISWSSSIKQPDSGLMEHTLLDIPKASTTAMIISSRHESI